MRSLMDDYITQQQKGIEQVTSNLLSNEISLAQWEESMALRIKRLNSTAYLLGKGGTLRYDSAVDKGRIGIIVRGEYERLRRFTNAIESGELTPAKIKWRARLYATKAYSIHQRAEQYSHTDEGFLFEKNILSSVENCADCLYFASLGIVELGTIPPVGLDRKCLNNCRCHKKFYRDRPENACRLLAQSWGWAGSPAGSLRIPLSRL